MGKQLTPTEIWDQKLADPQLTLTKDRLDEMVHYAASGASHKDIAWAAGVQPARLAKWMTEGRKLQDEEYKSQQIENAKGIRSVVRIERLYNLYIAIEQSKSRERIKVLERLKAAGPHYATEHSHKIVGQWQAAEAWLVRTSDEYLDKDKASRYASSGVNINISLEQIRKDLDKLEDPIVEADYKELKEQND